MSREDNVWHLLGEKGNQVTELVVLSSAISSKLVVLTGRMLALIKYLPWKRNVVFEDENPNCARWTAVLVSQPSSHLHDQSQRMFSEGSCLGIRKVVFLSSAVWKKQQPETELLPAHQGKQHGVPSNAPQQWVPAACSSWQALQRRRREASSLPSQPVEFKSSRFPCFPPPHFPLFSVFCVLAV